MQQRCQECGRRQCRSVGTRLAVAALRWSWGWDTPLSCRGARQLRRAAHLLRVVQLEQHAGGGGRGAARLDVLRQRERERGGAEGGKAHLQAMVSAWWCRMCGVLRWLQRQVEVLCMCVMQPLIVQAPPGSLGDGTTTLAARHLPLSACANAACCANQQHQLRQPPFVPRRGAQPLPRVPHLPRPVVDERHNTPTITHAHCCSCCCCCVCARKCGRRREG